MNVKNLIVIVLIFLFSCKNSSESLFTINEICGCYKNQQNQQIDKRLGKCLSGFNSWLNSQEISDEEKKKLGKEELFNITKELIKSCSDYQSDFNTVLLSRYESRKNTLGNSKKDSILNKINRGENSAVNKSILSEYEIVDGRFENAMNLVNESLSEKSEIEIAYWVRGFLHHQNGDFEKAIKDCENLEQISKNTDMIQAVKLWKINLKKEKKKN